MQHLRFIFNNLTFAASKKYSVINDGKDVPAKNSAASKIIYK